tara:strand:+ start:5056 stop:5400 length:345 start_codon:yes stop_codon:yes gene_type:complete
MANKKISQLNQLNVSDVDISTDVVAIVDSSTNTTKKVSVADLMSSNQSSTDKNYVHNQIASSASWVVNHNLNKFSSVVVVDSAGTVVTGEIVYDSVNTVTLSFSAPFSGKAYFN